MANYIDLDDPSICPDKLEKTAMLIIGIYYRQIFLPFKIQLNLEYIMRKKISNSEKISENNIPGISRMIGLDIIIEGLIIRHFNHFKLSQSVRRHHHFTLVLAYDVLEKIQNHTLGQARDFLGKRMTVTFKYKDPETNTPERTFVGVITQVSFSQEKMSFGNIILKGYSPTILMDSAPHIQSFGGKQPVNTAIIADQVIKQSLSTHKYNIRIDTRNKSYIPYSSQYRETHYNYLSRIAEAYGEQFYYDGETIHFGTLAEHEKPIQLIFGSNLSNVKIELKSVFVKSEFFGYNSSSNTKMTSSDYNIKHLGDISSQAYEQNTTIYKTRSLSPAPISPNIFMDIDDSQKSTRGSASVEVFTVSADTTLPFLFIGCVADIEMRKTYSNKTSYFTRVMITELTHEVDAKGYYKGSFQAISEGTGFMPKPDFKAPRAEPQIAIVVSNTDPLNQGRIQVRFDWQSNETTHFIRMMSPDAGGTDAVQHNRGFVTVPEVGDQVMVGFEYNHPDFPFAMGSMFHGGTGLGGGVNNSLKSLQTRSGIKILMNDDSKSITIEDPSGNKYMMDGQGNINVTAPGTFTINAGKDIILNAGNDMDIKAGNSMELMSADLASFHAVSGALFSAPLMEFTAPVHLNIQSGKTSILSEEETAIQGKTMHVAGMEKLIMHSDEETVVNSKGKTKIHGKDGNNLSNIPKDYNPLEKKMDGRCLAHFRPQPDWNGEGYGFDWVRAGDTDFPGDTDYSQIVGKKISVQYPFFTVDETIYRKLISTFSYYIYSHIDEEGTRSKKSYAVPYLTLYNGASALLDVLINNTEAPVSIELEYDHSKFHITHDPFILTQGNHKISLTINCVNEFSTDKTINVISTLPGRFKNKKIMAGAIQIKANKKRYEVPVVFINVITNLGGGKRSNWRRTADEMLRVQHLLKQAYVNPVFKETITLDLSDDVDQDTGLIHNAKKVFNSLFNIIKTGAHKIGFINYPASETIEASNLNEAHQIVYKIRDFLNLQLKLFYPDKDYTGVKKVFFISQQFEVVDYLQERGSIKGETPHTDINNPKRDSIFMFAGYTAEDIAHELMHSLGVYHTFDDLSKFMFIEGKTDNLMDYSEFPIKPISTYHWQWKILQENANPERRIR